MNRHQWITLAVAAANLLLVGLFPPFDYLSTARSVAPAFDGFGFVFAEQSNRALNSSFLQLEMLVILANAAAKEFMVAENTWPEPKS